MASDKHEAIPQFQQKLPLGIENASFDIALPGVLSETEKVKIVGILKDLV